MPKGNTDSERLFCHTLGYMEPLWSKSGIPTFDKRFDVVNRFSQEIIERGASNFLYRDGVNLFAHGHRHTILGENVSSEPGLYVNLYQSKQGQTCRFLAKDSVPKAIVAIRL